MHSDIQTFITIHNFVPFPEDLTESSFSKTEKQHSITEAIEELVHNDKTKGQQLFLRFYENDTELFWQFRALQKGTPGSLDPMFDEVGELVVNKLRYLEQILTDKMLKRDTDKTITAFYDHVRLFFPYFDQVGLN